MLVYQRVPPKRIKMAGIPKVFPSFALRKGETCIYKISKYLQNTNLMWLKQATIIVPLAKVAENQSLG